MGNELRCQHGTDVTKGRCAACAALMDRPNPFAPEPVLPDPRDELIARYEQMKQEPWFKAAYQNRSMGADDVSDPRDAIIATLARDLAEARAESSELYAGLLVAKEAIVDPFNAIEACRTMKADRDAALAECDRALAETLETEMRVTVGLIAGLLRGVPIDPAKGGVGEG